jgi:hypothetical protein
VSAEHLDRLIKAAVSFRPAQETHPFHQDLPCFAERADAEAFMAKFGGVPFDPKKDRGKGKLRSTWIRTEEWRRVLESGPLKLGAVADQQQVARDVPNNRFFEQQRLRFHLNAKAIFLVAVKLSKTLGWSSVMR